MNKPKYPKIVTKIQKQYKILPKNNKSIKFPNHKKQKLKKSHQTFKNSAEISKNNNKSNSNISILMVKCITGLHKVDKMCKKVKNYIKMRAKIKQILTHRLKIIKKGGKYKNIIKMVNEKPLKEFRLTKAVKQFKVNIKKMDRQKL